MAEKYQWRVNQTLTSNQFRRSLDVAVLASGSEGILFVIYHGGSNCTSSVLQIFDGSSWYDPVSLQLNILKNRLEHKLISIAVQKMTIYVRNEDTIYCIHVPTDEERVNLEEATQTQGNPDDKSNAVAQNVPTSLTPTDVLYT